MANTSSNIADIDKMSKATGTSKVDLQLLDFAKDFNIFIGGDCEAVIFGLLKTGMEPRISALLSMPDATIRKRIDKAIENHYIPDSIDIDLQIFILNNKLNALVVSEYGHLFNYCYDKDIIALSGQAAQKQAIIRILIDYIYNDKAIDNAFFDELYASNTITSITKDKLKTFFNYRGLCNGNNLFLNLFLTSGKLQDLDELLMLSETSIKEKIDNTVLNTDVLPESLKTASAYAAYIYGQIQKQYGTRALMLKFKGLGNQSITVFDNNGSNLFDIFKQYLVKEQGSNDSNKLLETTIPVNEGGTSLSRTFDFGKDSAREYFSILEKNNTGVNASFISALNDTLLKKEGFVNILASVQRLQSLVYGDNQNELVVYLLQEGFTSAYEIAKAGRKKFLSLWDNGVSTYNQWNKIFNAAELKVNKALAILSKYSQATNSLNPQVVRDKTIVPDENTPDRLSIFKMTELKDLFGSQNVNDVKECESVLGPAAYLVDLLDLLKQIEVSGVQGTKTLYEMLKERRPDLEHISLNCPNALTPVPFIDLVIEILEHELYRKKHNGIYVPGDGQSMWDTLKTEEEIKAEPDNCIADVYDASLKSFYSWKQPAFDLSLELLRMYLRASDIDRAAWMALLKPADNNTGLETLSFTQEDLKLFPNAFAPSNADLEGFYSDLNFIPGPDLNGFGDVKLYVKDLLEKSGLSLSALNELLESYYVNPVLTTENIRHTIHFSEKVSFDNAYLAFATEAQGSAFVYLVYQYKRLLDATNWTIPVLDSVLLQIFNIEIGISNLNNVVARVIRIGFVNTIAAIKRVQTANGMTNEQVMGLFGYQLGLSYNTIDNYYLWLFTDNKYSQDHKANIYQLLNQDNPGALEGKTTYTDGETLDLFMEYVLACLNISREEFKSMSVLGLVGSQITYSLIFDLIQNWQLMRVFKLSPQQLKSFKGLLTIEPNTDNIFVRMINLTTNIRRAAQLVPSINDLYILIKQSGQIANANNGKLKEAAKRMLALAQEQASEDNEYFINELVREVTSIVSIDNSIAKLLIEKFKYSNDPSFGLQNIILSAASSCEITMKQYELVLGYCEDVPNNNEALKTSEEQKIQQGIANVLNSVLNNVNVSSIFNKFKNSSRSEFITYLNGFKISNDTGLSKSQITGILSVVDPYYLGNPNSGIPNPDVFNDIAKERIAKELQELTSLPVSTITNILTAQLGNYLLEYLDKDSGLRSSAIDEDEKALPDYLSYLQKAILFVNYSGLNQNMLADYFSDNSGVSLFNIYEPELLTVEAFKQLTGLLELNKYLNALNKDKIFSLYKKISTTTDISNVCARFLWYSALPTTPAFDFTKLPIPASPLACMDWLKEIGKTAEKGINPAFIPDWLSFLPEDTAIINAKNTALHYLGDEAYLERMPKYRNALRVKQRDALLNYYLSENMLLSNANEVFHYLLIDTQMTPAVSTSRIVQATLSIQLMIQRIQFNLEKGVSLTKTDENKWKWMSLYRVWEANRRIFLYPENWLEPELRDDKSPFFKELEKSIKSNEISPETVEKAYLDYIEKLEDIANIEYCQMYQETVDNYSVLHVIGRTPRLPHSYYYRKFVNESYWTAWEPMEIDIQSDHHLPVVINGRLFLFWLEISEASQEPTDEQLGIGENNGTTTPKRLGSCWKINIGYSEYKNGKWAPKKTNYDTMQIIQPTNAFIYLEDIRLVYQSDQKNCLYVVFPKYENVPVSTPEKPRRDGLNKPVRRGATTSVMNGYSGFEIELRAYNHLDMTISNNEAMDIHFLTLPEGMNNYYQKAKDLEGAVILPIMNCNGAVTKNEIISISGRRDRPKLVYPAQYSKFNCQSPFIVEHAGRSFIFAPISKTLKANPEAGQIQHIVRQMDNGIEASMMHEVAMEMPEAFTDDNSGLVIVEDGNNNQVGYQPNTSLQSGKEENAAGNKTSFAVYPGYHPFIDLMRRNIERYGVDGLLSPEEYYVDGQTGETGETLETVQSNSRELDNYLINARLTNTGINASVGQYEKVKEDFDFDTQSPVGIYNWELFYHIPYLIANVLYTEGNYDEALKWMNYIFDPRNTSVKDGAAGKEYFNHFWKFRPFALNNDKSGIDDIMFDYYSGDNSPEKASKLDNQIDIWSNDPFKPHNVARMRINAYMKATVMRYIDILVARGDKSFRTDTMESINEALLYYVIASQILGNKPEVMMTSIFSAKSYLELNSGTMGNALEFMEEPVIKPENEAYIEHFIESNELEIASKPFSKEKQMKNMVRELFTKMQQTEKIFKLYFEIPKNDKLFSYWELVSDRLFKIRNSLNIDGIYRNVSLFAPPIDPGMLAYAASLGLDIKALVNGQAGPATQYRFSVVLNQALQVCGELKSLGAQLLSAYEKGDNEMVSNLRAHHEILLSENITKLKEKAIEESAAQLQAIEKQKDTVDYRKTHFEDLHKNKLNGEEILQLVAMNVAMGLTIASEIPQAAAAPLSLTPTFTAGGAGFSGSPLFTTSFGGEQASSSTNNFATLLRVGSTVSNHAASMLGMIAGYKRRNEDWEFQKNTAEKELLQLEVQRVASEIRKQMASYELDNHLKQIEISRKTYEVLQTKYTNEQLYFWMQKEISELHRKAYDMAYKLAKQAEKAYDFELNPGGFSTFISGSHFDSKYEGLMAGERLYQDLKAMEMSYQEKNKRKFEITKHVSLAMLNPQKIIDLRKDGTCEIFLPELLFDMDHPGHCNRRIKSVSVSIPCVTGPYTSVSANLTLVSNVFRKKDMKVQSGQPLISCMATSSGVNDSGMFQLNFNDERYLPFEGAGVESKWSLSLPSQVRQFDYNTISDVIISIQYTAEDGGNRAVVESNLKAAISTYIGTESNPFALLIDVKGQYPEVFEKLKTSDASIEIKPDMLPWFLKENEFNVLPKGAKRIDNISADSSVIAITNWGPLNLVAFQAGTIPSNMVVMIEFKMANN